MDKKQTGKTGYEGGNATWTMLSLPPVIVECCDFLERTGFDDEGIFRVTGTFRDINSLKEAYASGKSNLDLKATSSYSVAGVLTHYFTESQEPIFPFEIYDLCIECMEIDHEATKFECIRHMLNLLPTGNFRIIYRFLQICVECSKCCETNKMTTHNLAITTSPTLIRPKEETIETLIAHQDALTNLVELLIKNFNSLFNVLPNDSLPETVPDTFYEVYNKTKSDILKRLPEGWFEKHGRKRQAGEIPEEEKPIAKFQALWRGYRLRKKLKGLNIKYQTAYNIATWDYIKRESNFVHAMKRAIRDFETSLGDNKAGKRIRTLKALNQTNSLNTLAKNAEAEVKSMVYGFKMIIETHQMLYEELLENWDSKWPAVSKVGNIIVAKLPMFIVYNTYIDMYCRVDSLIHAKDANPELIRWMNALAGSSHCSRTLDELLKLPLIHLMGCKVPIQKFLNCVLTFKIDMEDTNNVVKAYALLSRLGTAVSALDRRLNFQRTLALEGSLLGYQNLCLAELNRTLEKRGPVNIEKQPFYIFLFDDICLVTTPTKDTYIYNFHIDMKIATLEDNTRLGFIIRTDAQTFQFSTKKPEDKVGYFLAFQKVINRWHTDRFGVPLDDLLQREQSSTIPQIVLKLTNQLREFSKVEKDNQFFCLGGDIYTVTLLRNTLNSTKNLDDVDLSKYDPPIIVDVLKLFLLELPTPLLNKADCEEIFTNKEESAINLVTFYSVIQSLPTSTKNLLYHMCELLCETSHHPSILAQTWGDTLYRGVTQNVNSALQIAGVTTVIRDLLLYYQDLCNSEFDPSVFYPDGEEPVYDEEEAEEQSDSVPLQDEW